MFTQPTVFVLGAGASMPYGYPSGQKLVDDISITATNKGLLEDIRREFGFDDAQKVAFCRALIRGKPPSIDQFLEANPAYLGVGKFCIAEHLVACESDKALFELNGAEHWYTTFFRQLAPSKEAAFRNHITIITFNYDRSLEHFLFEAFISAFGATPDEAKAFVRRLHIIHVHGMISPLPWQGGVGFEYSHAISRERMRSAIDGIKIIHEAGENDPGFAEARRALIAARYIFFLGFGYHETNLKRLAVPFDRLPRFEGDQAWLLAGTAFGVTRTELGILLERLQQQFTLPSHEWKIHEFMRNAPHYLYAAEGRP